MKRLIAAGLAAVIVLGCSVMTAEPVPAADNVVTMYRLYNKNSGEHFYTSNPGEKNYLVKAGWKDEGVGWYAPKSGDPVYRLYNKNGGEHHYTMKAAERNSLVRLGWKDEGIGWYSDTQQRVPLYRQYNPNAFANNHNYTSSIRENNYLVSVGWKAEGVAWYGMSSSTINVTKAVEEVKPVLAGITSGCYQSGTDLTDSRNFWNSMFFILFSGPYSYKAKEVTVGTDPYDGSAVKSSRRYYAKDVVRGIGRVMLNGSDKLPDFPDYVNGLVEDEDGYLLDPGVVGEEWTIKYSPEHYDDDATVGITVYRTEGGGEFADSEEFVSNAVSFILRRERVVIDDQNTCEYVVKSFQKNDGA